MHVQTGAVGVDGGEAIGTSEGVIGAVFPEGAEDGDGVFLEVLYAPFDVRGNVPEAP